MTRTRLAYFPRDDTNPYQSVFYRDLEDAGIEVVHRADFNTRWLWRHRCDTDVLHFHWPQGFYRVGRPPRDLTKHLSFLKFGQFMLRLALARALGYRVVWTIHQVYPHEILHRVLDRLAPIVLSRVAHGLIAHDEPTAMLASKCLRVRRTDVHVTPHPSYAGSYGVARPRADVRSELGISETSTVFLHFGSLRAYKNVDVLLEAFGRLAAEDVALIIAGLPHQGAPADRDLAERVRAAAAADPRIKMRLELIPPKDVADLFAAADAAVLPRFDGGTSGAIVLALDMGVPVIASALPVNEAITRGEAAGWLFAPGDPTSLQQRLEAAAADPKALDEKRAGAQRVRSTLGWNRDEQARTALVIRGDQFGSGGAAQAGKAPRTSMSKIRSFKSAYDGLANARGRWLRRQRQELRDNTDFMPGARPGPLVTETFNSVRDIPGYFTYDDAAHFVLLLRMQTQLGVLGDLLEIGTYYGRSTAVLAAELGSEERLLTCDPYEAETAYGYSSPPTRDAVLRSVSTLSSAASDGRLEIFEGFSADLDLSGRSFRFVHLDGSHEYDDALADLRLVIDHLVVGGIIAVDDYEHPLWPGVADAVREFRKERDDVSELADLNRHGAEGRKLYLVRGPH